MSNVETIVLDSLSLTQLHGYLLAGVAPRPIAFASTINRAGNINLSPFSFFNAFSSNPPILIFSPSRRGKDNTTKHTYENILEIKETVINIVDFPMIEQVSLASTEYEYGVNEFIKSGLTQIPSQKVKPPRVAEAPISFECVVDNIIRLGKKGGAGNLIISRVVLIHIQKKYLNEKNQLDITKLDLVGRMGGNWYCRTNKETLFEISKPLKTRGIGIDQLPENIRKSNILTGNNLGRLGNVEKLPDKKAVMKIKEDKEIKAIFQQFKEPEKQRDALHQLSKKYVESGDTEKALKILLLN